MMTIKEYGLENWIREGFHMYNSALQVFGYSKACELFQEFKKDTLERCANLDMPISESEFVTMWNNAVRLG